MSAGCSGTSLLQIQLHKNWPEAFFGLKNASNRSIRGAKKIAVHAVRVKLSSKKIDCTGLTDMVRESGDMTLSLIHI